MWSDPETRGRLIEALSNCPRPSGEEWRSRIKASTSKAARSPERRAQLVFAGNVRVKLDGWRRLEQARPELFKPL